MIGQHGDNIDATLLGSMPYADAIIREALRFISIVPAVGRVALKTFEVGGYTIPKASWEHSTAAHAKAVVTVVSISSATAATFPFSLLSSPHCSLLYSPASCLRSLCAEFAEQTYVR